MRWNLRAFIYLFLQSSGYVLGRGLSWTALCYCSNEVEVISFPDVFSFGKFNTNKDFMIIHHILLLAKFFIYV